MFRSYDDVMLEPQYSEVRSRKGIKIANRLSIGLPKCQTVLLMETPIISSPMDTVTDWRMALAMYMFGGLGILHRYNKIEEQVDMINQMQHVCGGDMDVMAAAVGVTGDYLERAKALCDAGCNVIVVDVAHGHHILMKEALEKLKPQLGECAHIMAGNVASVRGIIDLHKWGADSIRVGVGSGSICSTRIKTGHGVPTLEVLLQAKENAYCLEHKPVLIADGGLRNSGDIVKAIAAGADYVMLGSLLAGTHESPGDIIEVKGKKYKSYRGMASPSAQKDWKGSYNSNEGISAIIPYKGSVVDVLEELNRGIRSGFSYSGAENIEELKELAIFRNVSPASRLESSTHILGLDGVIG
jgi:IMP dehydrogenase